MALKSSLQLNDLTLEMSRDTTLPNVKLAYQEHLRRRQGLKLCKQLIALAIELQKHRGCTLAILSGDHFFETQLASIHRDITQRLTEIETVRREFLGLDESMHIVQEWICIRRLWSSSSPEENFILHSNLVTELLKVIWRVAERAKLVTSAKTGSPLDTFCFSSWLAMIETAAQARGLATHCAVRQEIPHELKARINYLLRQLVIFDQEFGATLSNCTTSQKRRVHEKAEQVEYSACLEHFIKLLESEFCDATKPAIDADTIYTAGSLVVSACQQVLTAMLRVIEHEPSNDLAHWIDGCSL